MKVALGLVGALMLANVRLAVAQCPVLTAPTNGARAPPTGANFYQYVITFTCNLGYQLNGASSVTCQANDTWTYPVPTCTRRQCSLLTAPTNGARTPPTGANFYQYVVTFTCNTGYQLNGASSVTCQANDTWTYPAPTCTPIQCSALTVPTNGALSTTARTYQTVVTTTCNSGYARNGAATTTCQANGTWSNPVPTCTPRPCPTLTPPTNGQLSPNGPHAFPSMVTFTCNSGYVRNGAADTRCQADGTWSNSTPPTCIPGQCSTLAAPANGTRTPPTGATSFQDTVTFTCDAGYVLNGAATLTCQAGGSWSNPVPTCTPRPCQTLTAPDNGQLIPAGPHTFPATATITCGSGYERNGPYETRCQADGSWSPVPTCTLSQIKPSPPDKTPFGVGAMAGTAVGCLVAGLLLGVAVTLLVLHCRKTKSNEYDTAEAVYADVRTISRGASKRSGTGSDAYYSYPMAPLSAPRRSLPAPPQAPLPTQPSSHYQELKPSAYQSLQRVQGTPQPQQPR
ncbi:P-selectin-like isoform X2 [Branchiostoma lanceolatum]|uniref:P-selectin-like isoform X2 n=1 Tax=Branchiostoma lanceolatum TaxID=7740 RepID=UPI0034555466